MTNVFLKLLNMSITTSWLVLAVMVIRGLFRKMPKWVCCPFVTHCGKLDFYWVLF